MSLLVLLLLLLALPNGVALRVIYVRSRHDCHLGCAEKALQPFEHLLLPRTLRCTERQCTNEGSIELEVHLLECRDGADDCSAQVLCQPRLNEVYAGLASTVAGFFAVLAFACAPTAFRQRPPIKLHKT
jgi:hypothetical protein